MSFDENGWEFPCDKLRLKRAFLCLSKREDRSVKCVGIRLECHPLALPSINYAYEEVEDVEPNVSLELPSDIIDLASRTLELGSPVEESGEDLGSVYLFGAHNPVGWQRIKFEDMPDGSTTAVFELFFNFECEDRIGGKFRHILSGPIEIERRWESE